MRCCFFFVVVFEIVLHSNTHQLLEVVLHCIGINHHTYGYQCIKGKVKDLVAEEWNNPSSMLLQRTQTIKKYFLSMNIDHVWTEMLFIYLVSTICCHATYENHE